MVAVANDHRRSTLPLEPQTVVPITNKDNHYTQQSVSNCCKGVQPVTLPDNGGPVFAHSGSS